MESTLRKKLRIISKSATPTVLLIFFALIVISYPMSWLGIDEPRKSTEYISLLSLVFLAVGTIGALVNRNEKGADIEFVVNLITAMFMALMHSLTMTGISL